MTYIFKESMQDAEVRAGKLPVLLAEGDGDIVKWADETRDALLDLVVERGSVLIRGLKLRDPADALTLLRRLGGDLMGEREAFASRKTYADGVYSSAAWPQNQPMCMHHELSYTNIFPGLMLFACLVPPDDGGATAVADSPTVLSQLPSELVDRFEREGWLLKRNYNGDIGLSYAEAFGNNDRAAIEAYCRSNAIEFDWQPDGGLRTSQRRGAVVRHPATGERCWFNQIAFLNEWTLDPEVREFLIDVYGADGLPFNTFYGNGDPLEPDVVETINQTYDANTVREPWQAGDLLLVDNIRTAHSREAFEGSREVIVAMASARARPDVMSPIVKEVQA